MITDGFKGRAHEVGLVLKITAVPLRLIPRFFKF